MKKIISTALTLSFLSMTFMPAFSEAISTDTKKLSRKEAKVLKAKTQRFNYINMPWWEDLNDEYLNEYIVKAFENNQDLKITTLLVEESRQMTKMQLAK